MPPPIPTGCRMAWRAPGSGGPRTAGWRRRSPTALEVVRVSGDSREVCWRGVYEAKGRKWVVREAPEVSEESHTWVDDTTQIILSSMP